MKKCIVTIFATLSITVSSQQVTYQKGRNEFSIHLGGGFSTTHYQLAPNVNFLNGGTFDLGIDYTFSVQDDWGIYTGVAYSLYKTRRTSEIKLLTSDLTDHGGYIFDLHTNFRYRETHSVNLLHLPIMLRFQPQHLSRKHNLQNQGLYAMGGIKIYFPVKYEYTSNITAISNAAYYPELDNWAATQKYAGLGSFNGKGNDGNLKINPSLMLSFETGVKWRLNKNFLLYTGIYFDFGLKSSVINNRPSVRNDIAVEDITDFTMMSYPNRTNIIASGIIFRLSYSQAHIKQPKKAQPRPSTPKRPPPQTPTDAKKGNVITYIVTGTVKSEGDLKPLKANISLRKSRDKTLRKITTNETGYYEITLTDAGAYTMDVTATGYFYANSTLQFNGDSVRIIRNFVLKKMDVGTKIVIDNILFDTNKATLRPESYPSLNKLVGWLRENSTVRIEISGHTDNTGTEATNTMLSKNRALSVREYLISQGIDSKRLEYNGYGSDRPIETNDTEKGRAANRRVEIEVK